MVQILVLSGGAEFQPESMELDRAMLRLVRRQPANVFLLPAAAVENPRHTVKAGSRYFSRLGAVPGYSMIVDADTAAMGQEMPTLENADIIYLADGSPLNAVNTLKASEALNLLRYRWRSGAVLAACGAGAMALCSNYWDGGVWAPGLDILQGLVIFPHHEMIAGRFSGERLRRGLTSGTIALGLDDATGVLLEGTKATVAGRNTVTVYHDDGETEYTAGQTFVLERFAIADEGLTG